MLLCTVIGSGMMTEKLSGGNLAIALLANTLATVFAPYVLIEALGPISGAHFNPVVTLMVTFRGGLSSGNPALMAALFIFVQRAAYWFTASTSFAKPAAVLRRMLSDTVEGIAPGDAVAFLLAQCLGGVASTLAAATITPPGQWHH